MKSTQRNRKSPRRVRFGKASDVPNSPLPCLVFRNILPASRSKKAEAFRKAFRRNGWVGIWTDTIYDYTHFHSNAHEVLGIGGHGHSSRRRRNRAAVEIRGGRHAGSAGRRGPSKGEPRRATPGCWRLSSRPSPF